MISIYIPCTQWHHLDAGFAPTGTSTQMSPHTLSLFKLPSYVQEELHNDDDDDDDDDAHSFQSQRHRRGCAKALNGVCIL